MRAGGKLAAAGGEAVAASAEPVAVAKEAGAMLQMRVWVWAGGEGQPAGEARCQLSCECRTSP